MSITRIVLTGGPCAGKTTMLSCMESALTQRGYKVLIVPEGATELIPNGIIPMVNGVSNETFQDIIIQKQLHKEFIYEVAATEMDTDKIVIVYDRGLMDGQAYISPEGFDLLLAKNNLLRNTVRERYDAVIHLVTAAKGAEEAYTTSNNTARRETIEEAIAVDERTLRAWQGHSHLRVIDNSTNFQEKINRAMKEVYAILGEPIPKEIERKYLIKMPDTELLLKKGAVPVHIVQTYLTSRDNIERRVRQRGDNGDYAFTYTEKENISGLERIERERKITMREYMDLLLEADTSMHPVVKDRYCLTYKNQYFELDMYQGCNDQAILEIELTDKSDSVDLPPWITVIKEVTEDSYYKNHQIAMRGTL